jgi:Bacterial PH domain
MVKLKFYLSKRLMLLNKEERGAPIPLDGISGDMVKPGVFERLWQKVGGDQMEIDANDLDKELHAGTNILLDEEKVIMAFKAGRDVSLFTNLRIMTLDVQGLSGKKVEYVSIPLRSIRSFSIETAGVWDRDTELRLYTRNKWDLAKVTMDFRSGKADIIQINKFLCALIIGYPSDAKVDFGKKDYKSQGETNMGGGSNIGAAFFDNSKEIDAKEIDTMLRSNPAFLLAEEKVVCAFKQARDMFVYTNRRIVFIDTKGLSGKRVNYRTIPYRWIKGYEFETQGHLDRDAELYAYTAIAEVQSERYPRCVPCEMTKQSIIVKKTDIFEMGKLFTDHILFGAEYPEEPEIDFS